MAVKCPECGASIGKGTSTDIYKHLVACLHVPDAGLENIARVYGNQASDHAKRVMQLVAAAGGKE